MRTFQQWWTDEIYDPFVNKMDSWFPGPGIPSDTINSNSSLSDINYYNNYYKNEIESGKMSSIVPNMQTLNFGGSSNMLGSTLGGIGSLVGGIGDVASSVFNFINQQKQLEYQKQLQKQIFEREDTAHQREIEDLRKAGLSPTLSVGGSGSGAGQVVSTSAPQFNNPRVDFLSQLSEKQKLDNMSLQNKLLTAQISQIMANTQSILNKSYGSELDNEYKEYRNQNYNYDFWLDKASKFLKFRPI